MKLAKGSKLVRSCPRKKPNSELGLRGGKIDTRKTPRWTDKVVLWVFLIRYGKNPFSGHNLMKYKTKQTQISSSCTCKQTVLDIQEKQDGMANFSPCSQTRMTLIITLQQSRNHYHNSESWFLNNANLEFTRLEMACDLPDLVFLYSQWHFLWNA